VKKKSIFYPHLNFEIANAHNGNFTILKKTINEVFKINYKNKSIKFQIFSPDFLSTKNYKWYPTYKKICFTEKQWNYAITFANKKIDVYLDIFDEFSIQILKKNLKNIVGIKLQPSVLNNKKIINDLKKIKDFKQKKLILNISGYSIKNIIFYYNFFKQIFKKVIVQVGFQDYPTRLEDLGLNKFNVLKKTLKVKTFALADHIVANDIYSKIIPLIGIQYEVDFYEKHFCLNRKKAKYDYFSSLELNEVNEMIRVINSNPCKSNNFNFINRNEKKYLDLTMFNPILNKFIPKGNLINDDDISYKRSKEKGVNFYTIHNLQKKFKILKKNKFKDEVIKVSDFKRSNIGVLIACRLKSSRLHRKALIKVANKHLITHCIENCLKSKIIQKVVLATSNKRDDDELTKIKINSPYYKIYRGSADDVIKRYIDCAKKNKLDTIVRVTGDCPLISSEIIDIILKKHFEAGADYSCARKFSLGTSVEVFSLNCLETIKKRRRYNISEYMTFYFINNPNIFKINIVDLPKKYIRNYRLTVDYEKDVLMLNKLFKKLKNKNLRVNINNIFKILDKYKSIFRINSNMYVKYKDNKKLINQLKIKSKLF
jgi:N,N'-diacetyllegionaminate synthase